jgi:hypothetical protein
MYYNSLRVINGEFFQHGSMPHHLSPLKNNSKNSRKISPQNSPSTIEK